METTPAPKGRHFNGLPLFIDYTNHRGERSTRKVIPRAVVWRLSPWHSEAQWILEVFDLDKQQYRDFAMVNIHGMERTG